MGYLHPFSEAELKFEVFIMVCAPVVGDRKRTRYLTCSKRRKWRSNESRQTSATKHFEGLAEAPRLQNEHRNESRIRQMVVHVGLCAHNLFA